MSLIFKHTVTLLVDLEMLLLSLHAIACYTDDIKELIKSVWYKVPLPEKTADIWRHYHWFPCQVTSEKRAQKFRTNDTSLPRSG